MADFEVRIIRVWEGQSQGDICRKLGKRSVKIEVGSVKCEEGNKRDVKGNRHRGMFKAAIQEVLR